MTAAESMDERLIPEEHVFAGDGVRVSLQGLAMLEDTHVKAVARHGVVVVSQGVASLERCILSGSGACGWYHVLSHVPIPLAPACIALPRPVALVH